MAREDFFGEYQVLSASGTDFGLDTLVHIASTEDDDHAEVCFTLADSDTSRPVLARYDAAMDALVIASGDPAGTMVISRFADPTPGSSYQSIYGIVIRPGDHPGGGGCPVWGATRRSAERLSDQPTDADFDGSDFLCDFRIRNTADTQFGRLSKIEIALQDNGFPTLKILDAMGVTILYTTLTFDAATCSAYAFTSGQMSGPNGPELVPIIVSLSVAFRQDEASDEPRRFVYGNFALGDPEQGGTFAGEEDDPNTGAEVKPPGPH